MSTSRKILEPSHLSVVLKQLNSAPKLELNKLRSLRLTLAQRNDHFGARHFLKEFLPRIQYANPSLSIHVKKVQKTSAEVCRPELDLLFESGTQSTIELHNRMSTAILTELMDMAGGPSWKQWKSQAGLEGRPIIAGEEDKLQGLST